MSLESSAVLSLATEICGSTAPLSNVIAPPPCEVILKLDGPLSMRSLPSVTGASTMITLLGSLLSSARTAATAPTAFGDTPPNQLVPVLQRRSVSGCPTAPAPLHSIRLAPTGARNQ